MKNTTAINEDKVKRELERSRKAMNLMFSRGLSKRSRVAKKQRKIAMGPMSKVSVDTSDREDSQTMLNMKDKIAETLLNSFNLMLNELSQEEIEKEKNSPQARAKRRIRKERNRKNDLRSRNTPGAGAAQGDKRDRQINLALRRGGKSEDKLPLFARGKRGK